MLLLNTKKSLALLVIFTFIFIFNTSLCRAQEKFEVGGKISSTITEKYDIAVDDVEGHIFNINKSEGTNTSLGKETILDNASVLNYNFSDLVNGNGTHQGYIILSKNGDKTIAKWKGKVTTTTGTGNSPVITFEGTYSYTGGTGQFENIQGEGTYKGKYTSEKTYDVEWKGTYFIKATK